MIKHDRFLFSTAAAVIIIACGMPAYAQDAAADSEGIRDIVVTARRTSENLQTTPVAVTALDTTALQERQIVSVFQIAQATPSLSVQSGGTGNAALIYLAIRGNAQNSPNSASDAAVGIYVDGVYYGRPMVGNLGLLDLATAEVLRGTQGTLFGRNTTGGALNMTTVQPGNEVEGYIRGGLGNYDLRTIEGAVTVPLMTDELSLRVAARYAEHDAYGKNPIRTAQPAQLDSDVTARATLRWTPNALPLTVTIGADIIRIKDTYNNDALIAVDPIGSAAQLFGAANLMQYLRKEGEFYTAYTDPSTGSANVDSPRNYVRGGGVYGTITYDFGDVSIKSITAWRQGDAGDSSDIDGTPYRIFSYGSEYRQKQFSEELQVSGKNGPLDWIAGAFYFREHGSDQSEAYAFQNVDLTPFGVPGVFANLSPSSIDTAEFVSSSKAVFAQANYRLTEALRITGGIRYTWDKRDVVRHGGIGVTGKPETFLDGTFTPVTLPASGLCGVGPTANLGPLGNTCNDPYEASFEYPAWLASIDYELGDRMFVYLKTGGAAMAGGINLRPTKPGFRAFAPEKVKDVEVGFKGDFLDRRVRTNIAAFHIWRNGAQNIVNFFDAGTGRNSQYVQNAGDVRAYGFEFEGTFLPWTDLEITTGVSRLWSKYAAGSFIDEGRNGPVDRSGEAVPQSPKWTVNVAATQKVPFEGGNMNANVSYAYTSSRNMGQETADLTYGVGATPLDAPARRLELARLYNQYATIEGYGLLNARLGVELDSGLEVYAWGKNLTQTHYDVSLFNPYSSLGLSVRYQGTPRTYGITAGYKW